MRMCTLVCKRCACEFQTGVLELCCVLPVCACVCFNACGERKRENEESCTHTHTHGGTGRMRVCMYDTLQYIKSAAPWMEGIGHVIMMAGECEWVCTALSGPV